MLHKKINQEDIKTSIQPYDSDTQCFKCMRLLPKLETITISSGISGFKIVSCVQCLKAMHIGPKCSSPYCQSPPLMINDKTIHCQMRHFGTSPNEHFNGFLCADHIYKCPNKCQIYMCSICYFIHMCSCGDTNCHVVRNEAGQRITSDIVLLTKCDQCYMMKHKVTSLLIPHKLVRDYNPCAPDMINVCCDCEKLPTIIALRQNPPGHRDEHFFCACGDRVCIDSIQRASQTYDHHNPYSTIRCAGCRTTQIHKLQPAKAFANCKECNIVDVQLCCQCYVATSVIPALTGGISSPMHYVSLMLSPPGLSAIVIEYIHFHVEGKDRRICDFIPKLVSLQTPIYDKLPFTVDLINRDAKPCVIPGCQITVCIDHHNKDMPIFLCKSDHKAIDPRGVLLANQLLIQKKKRQEIEKFNQKQRDERDREQRLRQRRGNYSP